MDLMLEESNTEKVPILLNRLVDKILGPRKSSECESIKKDLLFLVVLVLLKENGFNIIENYEDAKENIDEKIMIMEMIDTEVFSKLKNNGVYELKVIVAEFNLFPLKLILSPLGSAVLINIIMEKLNQETYSVCIATSRYIVSPLAPTVPMIFRDLKHLATTIKNKILAPVKSRVISHFGYPSASLTGLPDELLFRIVLELTINDIIHLSKTCSKINSALEDESLWHELFNRDFCHSTGSEDKNWKKLYKQSFQVKQNKRLSNQRLLAGSMHDYMDYSDYVSYIDNPMWHVL